jgi:hypothetical protein
LEGWNDGIMGIRINHKNPTFHYSNIPLFLIPYLKDKVELPRRRR